VSQALVGVICLGALVVYDPANRVVGLQMRGGHHRSTLAR